jgi:hypothetical protein
MSGDGRGVERGGNGDDGGVRRAIWTEDGRWHLTAAVDNEGGGRSMGGGVLCRQRWPTARRRRHNNQMKEEAAFGCPPTLSDVQSVGDGASAGCRQWRLPRGYGSAALSGQRRRCICGAQAAAHRRWRGVGGAFRRAGGRTGAVHLITPAMAPARREAEAVRRDATRQPAGMNKEEGLRMDACGGCPTKCDARQRHATKGDATTSRRTRGKREERHQWTRCDGASIGRGCVFRGGGRVKRTVNAPNGASSPGDTGEATDDVTIAENDTSNSSGYIFHGACLPFWRITCMLVSAVVVRCINGQAEWKSC